MLVNMKPYPAKLSVKRNKVDDQLRRLMDGTPKRQKGLGQG
jgi:hypothetical protein